jgi:glycolate oxidase FAD binding subunit
VSTETVREAILAAAAAHRPVRIASGGSWMNAGRPCAANDTISLGKQNGIVDYEPDDLTITVSSGATLKEIAAATRGNQQWLPLDPAGSQVGSIGATIATGSYGALAHSYGLARDFILGIEFVNGNGEIIRGGGRVVKNVAGFDLMRLLAGSWGTLGVITELTLRLYALPKRDRTFVMELRPGVALSEQLGELRSSPAGAIAMELLNDHSAGTLGLPARDCVLLRLAGNDSLVEAQRAMLGKLGKLDDVDGDAWNKLRELDKSSSISFRVSGLPTEVAGIWSRTRESLPDADLRSTFSRGVIRVALKPGSEATALDGVRALNASAHVIFDVLPANLWAELSPTALPSRISRAVRSAFDPHALLNPGILGA